MIDEVLIVGRRPLFSERLRLSRCRRCGPGMGMLARDVPTRDGSRRVAVPVLCRYCGGHSPAFVEENADA